MRRKYLLLLLSIFLLMGCQRQIPITVVEYYEQSITPMQSRAITRSTVERTLPGINLENNSSITPTVSKTVTESPRSTKTPYWTTWTPEVTYPIPTSIKQIEELLKTNGGCKLPCWWGIEPGKTTLDFLLQSFSPYSGYIAVKEDDTEGNSIVEMIFPVSEEISPIYLTHRFTVEQYIITELEVMPGNIEEYRFTNILHSFGEPKELWMNGYIDPSSNNPFGIYLYYPEKGILAIFGVNGNLVDNRINICPGKLQASGLVLWDPIDQKRFIDFVGYTHNLSYLQNEKYVRQLFKGMDFDFEVIESVGCFDTPKELWPGR